ADRVRIQRHELARPYDPSARLFEPGVRALARGEQPGLDELAALADDLLVHDRQQLVLADARPDRLAHGGDRGLGAGHAELQALDLIGGPYGRARADLALGAPP